MPVKFKHRPVTPPFPEVAKRPGKCQKPGCGKGFIGGPLRKFCDEHSARVRCTGK